VKLPKFLPHVANQFRGFCRKRRANPASAGLWKIPSRSGIWREKANSATFLSANQNFLLQHQIPDVLEAYWALVVASPRLVAIRGTIRLCDTVRTTAPRQPLCDRHGAEATGEPEACSRTAVFTTISQAVRIPVVCDADMTARLNHACSQGSGCGIMGSGLIPANSGSGTPRIVSTLARGSSKHRFQNLSPLPCMESTTTFKPDLEIRSQSKRADDQNRNLPGRWFQFLCRLPNRRQAQVFSMTAVIAGWRFHRNALHLESIE
jgi:hypothetical protein